MAKKKASSLPPDGDVPKKKAAKKKAAVKKKTAVKKKAAKKKAKKKAARQWVQTGGSPLQKIPGMAGLRADLLVGEANDADDPETRERLLAEALRVVPDHIPALVMAAGLREDPLEELELLRKAVEIAKGRMDAAGGPAGRPTRAMIEYIVARGSLASAEWNAGKLADATAGFEEVLELDPDDAIHARWGLLSCYLLQERAEDVADLLERYPKDDGPVWVYGAALASLRADPDAPESRRLLAAAVAMHPVAGGLLLLDEADRDARVEVLLDGLLDESADSEEEIEPDVVFRAERCAVLLEGPWRETEGALDLLASALAAGGAEPPRSRRLELPPIGSVERRAKLLEAPQRAGDVWRFEVQRLNGWVKTKQGPSRVWLAIVWSGLDEEVRGYEIGDTPPALETLLELAAQAMLDPRGPGDCPPARPQAAVFSDFPLRTELAAELAELGVAEQEAGPVPPELQTMLDALTENIVGGGGPPALASVEGLSAAQRKAFYRAAADYAKATPWKKGVWSEGIAVEAADADGKPWKRWCIVLGHNGQAFGLGIYSDEKVLASIARGVVPGGRRHVATMVDFQPYNHLDATDYDDVVEVLKVDLEDDFWPALVRHEGGDDLTPAAPRDAEEATVCLRAATAFVARSPADRKKPFSLAVEYAGRSIEATVARHLPLGK